MNITISLASLFDLVFNDIDNHAYPASLPAIEAKLRSGGVLIVATCSGAAGFSTPATHRLIPPASAS